MCLLHCAGLVAEYLSMIEHSDHLPIGCVVLQVPCLRAFCFDVLALAFFHEHTIFIIVQYYLFMLSLL